MRVLTYSGQIAETSYRNPEQFVKLAPPPFQQVCRTFGGIPIGTSKPRFRLALMASRYRLIGGKEVTQLDSNGNVKSRAPEELFIPRYIGMPEVQHKMYVLEQWHPAEWYMERGAGRLSVEYDDAGKGYRNMEPIWCDGAYDGVYWKFGQPLVLGQDAALDWAGSEVSVRWAIWATIKILEQIFDSDLELKREKEEAARVREQDRQHYREIARDHRSRMFIEPAVSMCG